MLFNHRSLKLDPYITSTASKPKCHYVYYSFKFDPYITYIASKPKAHNVIMWFNPYPLKKTSVFTLYSGALQTLFYHSPMKSGQTTPFPLEHSGLGPYCLQYRPPKTRDQTTKVVTGEKAVNVAHQYTVYLVFTVFT